MLETPVVDLFVIGGGVNGAGIARDAAGRKLSVVLCEKDDLAEGTSSRSGKLVHGGLRYLEYCEFRLVREALIEREILLNMASHIIWPMRFVLPHSPQDRPAWLVRLGLFLYDHLGGRKKLPGTRHLDLYHAPEGVPVQGRYRRGFEYSDCWVDDARLVILNAVDAAGHGAQVLTRTACVSAIREDATAPDSLWAVKTVHETTGEVRKFRARALVNAAGPWVRNVIRDVTHTDSARNVRLVKGSHIITRKFWEGPHAYLVQNHDRRVIFINPYESDRALIGTTDIPFDGAPENATIDAAEIDYLIDAVNRYFTFPLSPADVLGSFSGVRPLFDDGKGNPSAVTRDYVLDLHAARGAPLLNAFGGKITTYRKLAEHALHKLRPRFPHMGADWTALAPLPGGDIKNADFEAFVMQLMAQYPFLPPVLARRYGRRYGTRSAMILDGARSLSGLGRDFGGFLHEAEISYLRAYEWAQTPQDVLTRRTKQYLHMSDAQMAAFAEWFNQGSRDNRQAAYS